MERALRAEHSFWSDFFWMEPAFSPGRNESGEEWMKEEEREGVKERKRWREKGREGYRYTVVRSVSGKMPAGIHTKKGSDTRGMAAIGTCGPRKQEVKKPAQPHT